MTEVLCETDLVKSVRITNGEIRYIHFGKVNGRKLVILPGLSLKSVMGSAEAIVQAYSLLARDHDIYLFDHVTDEPEGYTVRQMADDTCEVFRKLKIEKANIMGVSMGGMVAQCIAIAHPEHVGSLILCSTASRIDPDNSQLLEKWKSLAIEKDVPSLMESFGDNVYTPSFYKAYKDIIIASGNGTTDSDLNNFIISVEAVSSFDVYDQLDSIRCPVFVIGAQLDKVTGVKASKDIAEKLDCRLYIYEDYGHAAYDEAPDYQQKISEFLNSPGE